ncbi:MAG: hypothetical protein A4E29_00695 [Methanomassiliicoccales archaeon PtaB.Bin134]|jgi:hypothetical protein|nr:MAG: hypothetical protein A4E29_00695 [Methanomassiliicoccales archaeon PtaB.Bin134]
MPRRCWATLLVAVLALSMGMGEVLCTAVDTEVSAGNNFAAWTPSCWRQTAQLDFAAGTGVNVDLATLPGSIILASTGTGTYTSAVHDAGTEGAKFDHAFWDRTLPSLTTVTLEIRASDSLSSGEPDAGWQVLGSGTNASLEGLEGRYVQWRAILTSDSPGVTPVLEEVRIYYRPV